MPYARLNGIELHWNERGSGDDVLLFLHGFPFDHSLWAGELASLPSGWRGIAPDLRGFGASRDHGHEPLTMAVHAADMIALLHHVKAERAVVCGLSMGGYIAFAMLGTVPGRIRALVLCDTRATADDADAREQRRETAERARREGSAAIIEAMLPKLVTEGTLQHKPDVASGLRAVMASVAPETIARGALGMAERPDTTSQLPGIRVPVLVLGGESDAVTPPDDLRALAAAIPGARLALLPNAGHVSNLENPAAFRAALHGFLAGLRG